MKILLRKTLQYLIGLLLLITGVGKCLDFQGFAEIVTTYQVFPASLSLPIRHHDIV